MTQHGKLLQYMLGFHKGAGCSAFTDEQMKQSDFKRGYDDGRKATRQAYAKASKYYKAELSIIRAATGTNLSSH